jgi:hypothetical protein
MASDGPASEAGLRNADGSGRPWMAGSGSEYSLRTRKRGSVPLFRTRTKIQKI